jgi:hypothetical protein
MGAVNDQRREMGLPTIGSAENVAMIVAAALDQLMHDARRAGLAALVEKLDAAFQQAVEDCKAKTEEEACLSEQ